MRDDEPSWKGGSVGPGGAPMIVWVFIAISVCVHVLWSMGVIPSLENGLRLGSVSLEELRAGKIWTPFTYQFVHQNFFHLVVNMVMLFFLGKEVALRLGPIQFVSTYLLGGVAAAFFGFAIKFILRADVGYVGASGSISALLGVFAMLAPNQVIGILLFFVIPIRGRLIRLARGWIYLSIGLGIVTTVFFPALAVGFFNHAGGTLYGFLHGKYFLGFKMGQKKSPRSKTVPYTKRGENPNIIDAKFTDKKPDYDEVLDKINREGISALTPEEREILERASEIIKGKNKS